jgi:Cys-tRNA(Pro)/Cys-tRNA(Cys) deacylase
MKKPFPTFFHQTALDFDIIFVSAGVRGLQLKINPQDLISYVKAEVVDLVQSKEKEEDNEYNW